MNISLNHKQSSKPKVLNFVKINSFGWRRMGFKKIDQNLGFTDLALANSVEKNRSSRILKHLDKVIDWYRIEIAPIAHYEEYPRLIHST